MYDCFPHLPIRYSTKTRQVGLKTDTKICGNSVQRNLFQAKFSLPLCIYGCLSSVAISMKFAVLAMIRSIGSDRSRNAVSAANFHLDGKSGCKAK